MDTRIIKGVLGLATLAWAVFEFIDGNIASGIFITLLAALIIFFVFRSVRVLVAFLQLRRQKFDSAKKWLDRINENHLFQRQQAYYYYLRGLSESQTNVSQAEKYFTRALKLGLKQTYDKAVAKLQLAMIAASKRRKREAMNLIADVKKLDKKKMLKEQIKMAQQAMKRI